MRVFTVVIDSFGIGYSNDSREYGDHGANTALSICNNYPQPKWPTLKKLGLGNASLLKGNKLDGCEAVNEPIGSFGVLEEVSLGKDTTTGHWEIAGLKLEKAFHTFKPEYPSFPKSLIDEFTKRTGYEILGNKSSSGTVILEELGEEHLNTGKPICYTSADSVFQIAAHTDVISLDKLYELCKVARELVDPYQIGRVIARPFIGEPGNFKRTKDRHDFSIALPDETILDKLAKEGIETVAVGKIGSIFNEQGIDISYHDSGNEACMNRTMELVKNDMIKDRFVFVNLVDTDMHYGHRRDIKGYMEEVERVDSFLDEFIKAMRDDDYLIITADHGCDPGFKGSDHTREDVPLLFYNKKMKGNNLDIRSGFYDIAQTVAKLFNIDKIHNGESFI